MAFINAPLPAVTSRRFSASSISRRTFCRVNSAPPPESRYANYYPSEARFYAPHVRLTNVPGFELLNRLDLSNKEVVLDEVEAANLLRALGWLQMATRGDWGALFTSEERNEGENVGVVERYYPRKRRYEVPMVRFNDRLDATSIVIEKLAEVGAVEREKMKEEIEATSRVQQEAERAGAFWKRSLRTPGVVVPPQTATQIIDKYFPADHRNMAPVIEFRTGELGISVSMQRIEGGPKEALYIEKYNKEKLFHAPEIRMQPPQGDWDIVSGYVEVSSVEVQLPILETTAPRAT